MSEGHRGPGPLVSALQILRKGTTKCCPPGPNCSPDSTCHTQSYHHRRKGYGGRWAQPLPSRLAKALFWDGAVSEAAGSCLPWPHPQGKPGEAREPTEGCPPLRRTARER